ncbi:MAG: hypothetical protein WC998_01995 [Candidatus Paceibacterota bacterium]|jgi:hypothetical protein
MNSSNKKIIDNDFKKIKICMEIPEEINIELIQSQYFKGYEIFQWFSTFFSGAFIGFLTAFCGTNGGNISLIVSAVIFLILTIIFIVFSLNFRKKMFSNNLKKIINFCNIDSVPQK